MKLKKFLKAHQPLVKDVATSTCLIGASAGIVFGISAGMFKIEYMPLNSPEARLFASQNNNYRGENILSGWNMRGTDEIADYAAPKFKSIRTDAGLKWWKDAHPGAEKAPWQKADAANAHADIEEEDPKFEPVKNEAITARHNLVGMVIDGSTQSTMDRSFNQSLYEGLVDYIKNKPQETYDAENQADPINKNTCFSYKPAQDNTTEFINIYLSAMEKHTVLGLAGFQHATPLNSLMIHAEGGDDGKLKPLAQTSDPITTKEVNETAFLLVDSNIPNNQNIASVQFRADQPGFLTALATCQYLFNNLDMYHDKYQDLSVAAFGGVQIPTVTIYMGGFQRGIELFNNVGLKNIIEIGGAWYYFPETVPPDMKHYVDTFTNLMEHSKYKEEFDEITGPGEFLEKLGLKVFDEYSIKMIKLGDIGTHFSGTFAAGDAIGLTKQYLNRGASAIIAVAGPQSLDAAQEVRNQNSKAIVIGVDTPMENSDYQRFHNGCDEKSREQHVTSDKYMDKTVAPDGSTPENANGIIKFSAIKDIKRVTKQVTRLSLKGDLWDISSDDKDISPDGTRAICGPGFQTCGNILNGLISISWDGFYPLIQALENIQYFESESGGEPLTLGQLWETRANEYLALHKELNDTPYANLVTDINNLKTYNKKDGNGKILYDHYNHTIAILGSIMERGYLDFDRTMTLRPKGNQEYEMLAEGEKERYSLLNWLTINMYLTC